jgi:hypothetical protein
MDAEVKLTTARAGGSGGRTDDFLGPELADRALTVIGAEEKWTPDEFIGTAESLEESARERLNDLTRDYFLIGDAIAEMLFACIKRNRGLIHTFGADVP